MNFIRVEKYNERINIVVGEKLIYNDVVVSGISQLLRFSIEIAPCGIAFGKVDCSKREGGDIKWYFASENPRFSRLDMTLETVLSFLIVLLVVSAEGNLKRSV